MSTLAGVRRTNARGGVLTGEYTTALGVAHPRMTVAEAVKSITLDVVLRFTANQTTFAPALFPARGRWRELAAEPSPPLGWIYAGERRSIAAGAFAEAPPHSSAPPTAVSPPPE